MKVLEAVFVLMSANLVMGQRGSFAGSKPIGYPDIYDKKTTTLAPDELGNRFGEGDTTTERLPIEANGDRDLIDRISKMPIDKQPFWYLNWKAAEANRKKPQSYPQQSGSVFAQPLFVNTNNVDSGTSNRFSNVNSNSNTNLNAGTATANTVPNTGTVTANAVPNTGTVVANAVPNTGAVVTNAVPNTGTVVANAVPNTGTAIANAVPNTGTATANIFPNTGTAATSGTSNPGNSNTVSNAIPPNSQASLQNRFNVPDLNRPNTNVNYVAPQRHQYQHQHFYPTYRRI